MLEQQRGAEHHDLRGREGRLAWERSETAPYQINAGTMHSCIRLLSSEHTSPHHLQTCNAAFERARRVEYCRVQDLHAYSYPPTLPTSPFPFRVRSSRQTRTTTTASYLTWSCSVLQEMETGRTRAQSLLRDPAGIPHSSRIGLPWRLLFKRISCHEQLETKRSSGPHHDMTLLVAFNTSRPFDSTHLEVSSI